MLIQTSDQCLLLFCWSSHQCRSVGIGVIVVSVTFLLSVINGLVLFAYYAGCDPLTSGKVNKPDQVRTISFSILPQ